MNTDLSSGSNLFSYCSNNPTNNTDSDGHFAISLATVAAIAIAAVAAIVATTYVSKQISQSTPAYSPGLANVVEQINKKHPGKYSVYQLIDQDTGEVGYAGMTKNLDRRLSEHAKSAKTGDLVLGDYVDGLTYAQARSLEQQMIVSYNLINAGRNSINSISPKNSKLEAYMYAFENMIYNEWSNERYLILERFPGG